MVGGYLHDIDPVLADVAGVHLWWYGLGFALGFLQIHQLLQRIAFFGLLAGCLTIPSNWTQNIPVRYGARHPGLTHSWLYPPIDWAPPPATPAARRPSRAASYAESS